MSDITSDIHHERDPSQRKASPNGRTSLKRACDPPLADYRRDGDVKLISPVIVSGTVRLLEFALVTLLGLGIFLFYVGAENHTLLALYVLATLASAALTSITFHALQLYDPLAFLSLPRQISRVCIGWSLVLVVFLAAVFFLQIGAEYSRVWLALWYFSGLAALLIFRTAVSLFVRHWAKSGLLDRRAVIVGAGPAAEKLVKALEASSNTDIRICGIFDDRADDRVSKSVSGYPMLGNVSELVDFGRKTRVDLLIVSLPITAENRLLQILKKLWVLPVDIHLSAHTNALRFRPRTYSYIGNVPVIDIQDKPIADWDHVLKWLFDKVVATAMIIALAPVMALVALAVRLDSRGPILFKQRRYGFNNELVEVYKFRSMYTDQSDQKASKLVTKDDPRVTPVGRFIRKTSLDELPQLFNVLKGSLSLVGPRPHATEAKAAEKLYVDVVDGYFARHRVKPGITGWAQINGWRGETDTREKIEHRVEHDLYYIENWSVFFDMYILLMTPFALLNTKDAF